MSPTPAPRYNVLGVGISALAFGQARDLLVGAAGQGRLGYVCLATAHGLAEARADPAFRRILNSSWLTTPDGMPLVWLAPRGVERVYGPDLMEAVVDTGRVRGLRHFLFGGKPGVAAELRDRLVARFPGAVIAGISTPPFRDLTGDEAAALRREVAAARPDIVWVGIGTPKQERFMAGLGMTLDAALLVGVGAAFDFHSGRVRQAPRWMRGIGLEWLFRLCMEPGRLGPRYLRTNPLFLWRVALQKSGLRDYPLE
ncbi:MAG TPA: WecB/TagA/CpsF family glycosyltransferase [Opitutaceae bacterium]|jgi:N-acetylglucosaminyldiphosphoundecaprenol N-acetyl-beta-D-mannosaminyltransferase